ncbi:formylglycine-generating enzyme family protein [Desulfovibrio sp. OttesenSCG-928-G15]|nr:formylglycine-generating enzyme family protein [Desulfovibrio sp. OttesenSCG-928-G15]
MKKTFFLTALLLLLLTVPAAALAANCPPQPEADDLVLPGPGDTCFAFRAVDVGDGKSVYVQKRFLMGNQEDGFKSFPTAITVAGPFSRKLSDTMDTWFYYIGKYEVTEAQYYAVMGLPQGAAQAKLQSNYPVTNVSFFDAMAFVNKLNLWLYANAAESLPKRGSASGFVRLPTEGEWEFAARGGLKSRTEQFNDEYPYEDNLAAYEWFFGPSSSHGKLQEAGKLKGNPLGVHDMLGNVSEMVLTAYQLEYYQGNTGGVTTRGGNYSSDENRIRASLRVEQPYYIHDPKKGTRASSSATTGFRLAFGATVLSDKNIINAYQEGWDEYIESPGKGLPAQLSTAPTEERAGVSVDDARASLLRVRESVSKAGLPGSVLQDLGSLEAGMNRAGEIRKQADGEIAHSLIRIAAHVGFTTARESYKLGIMDDMLAKMADNPQGKARVEQRKTEVLQNITEALDVYNTALESLLSVSEEVEKNEVEKHAARLEEMNIPGQKWALGVVQKHSAQFRKDKRGNTAAWREDFKAIPEEFVTHRQQKAAN